MDFCMIPVFLAVRDCTMTREGICTSKYRKNEYMSTYTTMNGAKIAFKIPMKMKRLLSLDPRQLRQWNGLCELRTHQSTPFDSCSSGTPSSLVPFYQTGTPSNRIGDSIRGRA